MNDYTDKNGVFANIYFRDVDFSLNATRQAMYDYVQELVDMKYAGTYPTYDFWLVTFDRYVADKNITILPFEEQLDQFLSEDIHEKHKEHIVLDGEGNMLASRTVLVYTELDSEDIKETIDALEEQERISRDQPINQGLKDWAFFTFSGALRNGDKEGVLLFAICECWLKLLTRIVCCLPGLLFSQNLTTFGSSTKHLPKNLF